MIKHEDLKEFATELLIQIGFANHEAPLIAEHLVESDMCGYESHGVQRIRYYHTLLQKQSLSTGKDLTILKDKGSYIHADAHLCLSMVHLPAVIDNMIEKAGAAGIVTAAVKNCGHTGRLGSWAQKIGDAGLIGLVMNNDNGAIRAVTVFGGTGRVTSTNPVAFAVPTEEGVFVADFATSAAAIGKIRVAHSNQNDVPEGWLVNAEGLTATSPGSFLSQDKNEQSAILPMGGAQGHKGTALGLFIDMLTAGLSGGTTPPAYEAPEVSNVVLTAWDPECFSGLDHVKGQAQKLLEFARHNGERQDRAVRLPGDNLRKKYHGSLQDGVSLSAGTINLMREYAEQYALKLPVGF